MAKHITTRTHIDSVNNEIQEATMRLYGTIGNNIDGDLFAQELASLDNSGMNTVHIRINSPGGDVFQGMSIVSAIMSMKTPVFVHIDGVAASMAAIVAVASKRVYMMDFAKLMIHDPYFSNSPKESLSAKEKECLSHITDMLRKVLSRRGHDEAKVAKLMQEETWLSASEAIQTGLCDEIIPSAHSDLKNLTPLELVALVNSESNFGNKNKPMNNNLRSQIITLLGLGNEATDSEILDNIEALLNSSESIEESVNNALRMGFIDRSEISSFTAMAKSNPIAFRGLINDKRKAQKQQLTDTLISAIKKGKIIPQDRYLFETVGDCMGANAVNRIIECIPDRVRLTALVSGEHKNRANWKLSDYRKYAPQELCDNQALYARLLTKEGLEMELNTETLEYYRRNNPEYLASHPEEYQRLINNKKSI